MQDNPLGRETPYVETYDPSLLYPVSRADGRATLGLEDPLPFTGRDLWTAYELCWLDPRGRPRTAVLTLEVPVDSPNLIESKSLKLYLGSFAMMRLAEDELRARLHEDFADAAGSEVGIHLAREAAAMPDAMAELPGDCIDEADVDCDTYELDASLLQRGDEEVEETLHSHGLRSLCPVTGQPDFGSVMIRYRGPRIERGSLLQYLTSFRRHGDFHELCVEHIFVDLQARCGARELSVYARYNRRGGIDINPWRSNFEPAPPRLRLWRQ